MQNAPADPTAPATGHPQAAPATRLALRRVGIDTYRENVAYLHRDCAVYRAKGFQALSMVEVQANGRRILARMNAIIAAQGATGFDHNHPGLGHLSFEVRAASAGVVTGIDNLQIACIARLAGAPDVKTAGVDLLRTLAEPVASGDPLYRVHSGFAADLGFARKASEKSTGYTIGSASDVPRVSVEF